MILTPSQTMSAEISLGPNLTWTQKLKNQLYRRCLKIHQKTSQFSQVNMQVLFHITGRIGLQAIRHAQHLAKVFSTAGL